MVLLQRRLQAEDCLVGQLDCRRVEFILRPAPEVVSVDGNVDCEQKPDQLFPLGREGGEGLKENLS